MTIREKERRGGTNLSILLCTGEASYCEDLQGQGGEEGYVSVNKKRSDRLRASQKKG